LRTTRPPSGYFDFFPNKIFVSKVWLEIGWEVVKHRNTLFSMFCGVGRYRLADKWLEPQNSTEILVCCPLGISKKGSANFCDHRGKGKVFANIFYVESLFATCLV